MNRSFPFILTGLIVAFSGEAASIRGAITVSNETMLPASLDGHNITHDSLTGLDWLDPTATTNKSFTTMNDLLTTATFAGFRHATRVELREFLNHLGLPLAPIGGPAGLLKDDGNSYDAAAAIIGSTQRNIDLTAGITADIMNTSAGDPGHAMSYAGHSRDGYSFVSLLNSPHADTTAQVNIGHWLVRQASASQIVPEPTSLAIWLGVGIAIVHFRRKARVISRKWAASSQVHKFRSSIR